MTAPPAQNVQGRVKDPTLYLAFSFAGWLAREQEEEAERRILKLETILRGLDWAPPAGSVPRQRDLAYTQRRMWDEWAPPVDTRSPDGWRVHRHAQAYHEEVLVLAGVSEDDFQQLSGQWDALAAECWAGRFARDNTWDMKFALPHYPEAGDKPRLLGRAWVWSGEWDAPPGGGWAEFGARHYGPGGFAVFSWGLLGYLPPAGPSELPRLDLHTTTALKAGRDLFMFSDLTPLLLAFVKATQFLGPRFARVLEPTLTTLATKLEDATKPVQGQRFSLQTTEGAVWRISRMLFDFSAELAKLEEDGHGAELAQTAVVQVLDSARANGPCAPDLVGPPAWLAGQIKSALAYFKTIDEHAKRALETHRTQVEIEQAHGQNRLAVVGIMLGVFVGLGSLLPEKELDKLDWTALFVRLALSVGIGAIGTAVYLVWSRRTME